MRIRKFSWSGLIVCITGLMQSLIVLVCILYSYYKVHVFGHKPTNKRKLLPAAIELPSRLLLQRQPKKTANYPPHLVFIKLIDFNIIHHPHPFQSTISLHYHICICSNTYSFLTNPWPPLHSDPPSLTSPIKSLPSSLTL